MSGTKSILTEEGYCVFCNTKTNTNHHLVFGSANRRFAEEDGLKIPVCDNCHTLNKVSSKIHDNPIAESLSKMLGQMAFEKRKVSEGYEESQARDKFRKRYGRSYL